MRCHLPAGNAGSRPCLTSKTRSTPRMWAPAAPAAACIALANAQCRTARSAQLRTEPVFSTKLSLSHATTHMHGSSLCRSLPPAPCKPVRDRRRLLRTGSEERQQEDTRLLGYTCHLLPHHILWPVKLRLSSSRDLFGTIPSSATAHANSNPEPYVTGRCSWMD